MTRDDWNKGFSIAMRSADPGGLHVTERRLSQMSGMYADGTALSEQLAGSDPIVYTFHELGAPANAGDIAFGISTVYPGKVGDEYYMTKGHFHEVMETAEVYYGVSGTGMIVMENAAGDARAIPLTPGQAVYVPRGYAHRSVNTGSEAFSFFFAFRADAGHDYGTIESRGFRIQIMERDGAPTVVENPKWQG